MVRPLVFEKEEIDSTRTEFEEFCNPMMAKMNPPPAEGEEQGTGVCLVVCLVV